MDTPSVIRTHTALRSLQKTGGLFDTCVPGVTDGKVTSEEDLLNTTSTTAPALDAALSFVASEPPSWVVGGDQFLSSLADVDMSLPVTGGGADVGVAGVEENFGEMFTDLTDFLLENVVDLNVPMIQPQVVAPSTSNVRRKRTATEALLDAMETEVIVGGTDVTPALLVSPHQPPKQVVPEVVSQVVPTSPVVDHLGYTLKPKPKKRARMSTTSTVTSADTVAESTTVSFPAPSPAPSTSTTATMEEDEEFDDATCSSSKSVVRRIKNNIASKRSREIRKQKFKDQETEVERLKTANAELRIKIAAMEKEAESMKAALVKRLARK